MPATLAALLVLGVACGAGAAALEISRSDAGWTVKASGARVEDVLAELAAREPFAVSMQLGLERPLVDVDLRDATLERVLRDVLRGRNHTIAFRADGDDLAVSRVEVMLPRAAREPAQQPTRLQYVNQPGAEAARRAAVAQRAREQALFQRMRQANQAQRRQVRAPRAVPQAVAASEPLPLRRQLWLRIWSQRR
ncbi:MAG: hypothetical protein FJ035_09935 [Chloroflexi bacterium]|nr:hypothetical protein [Chloroflexota bacterium]